MSACDTSITITGAIQDAASLDKLVAAIVADRPTGDWSSDVIRTEAEALQHIRDRLAGGEDLIFAENKRYGDSFPHIERACRDLGLAYVRTVSVDEEFDTAGSRDIYDPVKRSVETLTGVESGLVSAAAVLDLLKAGRIAEAQAMLEHVLDPEAGLPVEFSVADGLLNEPAMRM